MHQNLHECIYISINKEIPKKIGVLRVVKVAVH